MKIDKLRNCIKNFIQSSNCEIDRKKILIEILNDNNIEEEDHLVLFKLI